MSFMQVFRSRLSAEKFTCGHSVTYLTNRRQSLGLVTLYLLYQDERILIPGALRFANGGKSPLALTTTVEAVCQSKLLNMLGPRIPPGPTILLRATRFAGFASFLIAKQDALRSLGGGGLSECATSICCKANRLWSTLCRHHVRPEAAACTMPESLRIRPNTFPGNW